MTRTKKTARISCVWQGSPPQLHRVELASMAFAHVSTITYPDVLCTIADFILSAKLCPKNYVIASHVAVSTTIFQLPALCDQSQLHVTTISTMIVLYII
jgi:hypothetical protein